ncbi:hypothetical protein [Photobacterium leiognathi]|uniref:hypothetical protein n=1 Tax=Photobacterium leiognathi TaxID=553611 RepID=UPI002738195C|nr:hypothetical protein [Photobacterium leiognathi]
MSVVSGVTERLSIALTPSLIPLPQSEVLGVVLLEQPSGANLTYQWYRLPGVLGGSDVWPVSAEITGATANNYTVTADDQGYYFGVVVTDASGSGLSARALSSARAAVPSASDSLSITGSISVSRLYENSAPQFQAQLLRNGSLDTANSANITANWYLVDTRTQRSAPETWQALTSPLTSNSLQGHAGRYLLLHLSYRENTNVKAQHVVLSDAIEGTIPITPDDIDGDGIANEWDSDIDGDGVDNNVDDFPEDKDYSLDIDGDGTPDSLNDANITGIEITSDDSYTIDNDELVRFIPITLSNGGTLVTSHALIGNASIVDNTLLYQAPSEMPQQMYLEYEWINDKGDTMSGQLLLLASSTDPTKPRFDDVTPVDIQAKGLFTSISGLSPTARDILGNPVPVSLLDGMPRLRSGSHIVYWEAIDPSTQATQIVGQLYRVFPQVDFEQRAIAYEGGETQVTVHLSGASPNYPVTIPVVIDSEQSTSDVNDHTLNPLHTITIDSGLKGTVRFFVNDDGISEGEERLNLSFGDGVNKGVFDSLTVNLLESEPMPSIKAITVDKQGKIRSLVYPELVEQLALKAQIFKPKASDKVLIDWFIENDGEKEPLGQTFDEELLPLDFVLPVGRHHFHYQAKVLGNNSDVLNGKMTLRVMNTQPLSRTQDSDRDGALDNVEGLVDSDNDLIPDYLDAINSCELQVIDNEKVTNGGFVLQSSPGSCIQLGRLSEKAGTYSPYVENSLRSATDEKGQELLPPDIDNISIYIENDVNNFTITDVFNESVIIVLPLMKPLETGSVYRKYTERSGWFTFDENEEGSNLRYAQGELGFCPAPGSDQYQETPILGAYCLEVTLKDGGVHDDDAERNGQIDDPGYMAYPLNTLVIPSFTVTSEAVNDSQTNLNKLQFNLCNYITTVDCQRLSVISSSVDYGGMITSERQEITVTLPSWVRETTIYLTIYDGNNLVTLPVHLIVTLEEQHDNNKDIAIKGGSLNLNELLMLWLCYCIVSLFFGRGKFKYYRMTFKNVR